MILENIKKALIDLNDWIYLNCGNFDTLIYLLPVLMLFGAIYWGVRAVWHRRRFGNIFANVRKKSRLNEVIRLLFVCYGVFLICGLLTPTEFWRHLWKCMVHNLNPFEDFGGTVGVPNLMPAPLYYILNGHLDWLISSGFIIHLVLNIALFFPFGFALPFIYKKATLAKTTLIGLSLSLVVEIAQIFISGRDSDIDDLLCNVVGVVVGYMMYALIKKVFPKFSYKCKLSVDDVFQELSGYNVQT